MYRMSRPDLEFDQKSFLKENVIISPKWRKDGRKDFGYHNIHLSVEDAQKFMVIRFDSKKDQMGVKGCCVLFFCSS